MGVIYHIKTAKSPTDRSPIRGGGSWIVNRHSGYYLGRVEIGDLFEVVYDTTSKKVWHYGRSYGLLKIRGFIMPGSLGKEYKKIHDTCSPSSRHNIERNRRKFGDDFNAAASDSETGTSVKVIEDCNLNYNYFVGNSFHGGYFRSKMGPMALKAGSHVLYRFTTLDKKAVVVLHRLYGWGFAPASCIERPSRVYHDNG